MKIDPIIAVSNVSETSSWYQYVEAYRENVVVQLKKALRYILLEK